MDEHELYRMRDENDVQGLIKVMEGDDFALGFSAAILVSGLGDEAAFTPLVRFFMDHVREKLILGQHLVTLIHRMRVDKGTKPNPDQVAPLLSMLNDPDEKVKYWVKQVFSELGDPRYAEAGGIVIDEETVHLIISDTRDLDPKKCHSATMRLVEIGPLVAEPDLRAEIVDRLLEILRLPVSDEYGPARYNATRGLGLMGDIRAVDHLIAALQDPGWMVREQAAISLSELKDPRAIPALKNALNYPDDITSKAAKKALLIFERMGLV